MKSLLKLIVLITAAALTAQEAPSDDQLLEANNPLASKTALSIQNYYVPKMTGTTGGFNSFFIRFAQPLAGGNLLLRASVPVNSAISENTGTSESGLGNSNVFLTWSFFNRPKLLMGAGPYLLTPGTIGAAKDSWQAGAAFVAFVMPSADVQYGGLITWNTDISGSVDTSLLAVQPILFVQAGNGVYLRSAPVWTFDFAGDKWAVPLGLGIGKVVVGSGGTVFNGFIEPQYTIAAKGDGQPSFQLYSALNMQF